MSFRDFISNLPTLYPKAPAPANDQATTLNTGPAPGSSFASTRQGANADTAVNHRGTPIAQRHADTPYTMLREALAGITDPAEQEFIRLQVLIGLESDTTKLGPLLHQLLANTDDSSHHAALLEFIGNELFLQRGLNGDAVAKLLKAAADDTGTQPETKSNRRKPLQTGADGTETARQVFMKPATPATPPTNKTSETADAADPKPTTTPPPEASGIDPTSAPPLAKDTKHSESFPSVPELHESMFLTHSSGSSQAESQRTEQVNVSSTFENSNSSSSFSSSSSAIVNGEPKNVVWHVQQSAASAHLLDGSDEFAAIQDEAAQVPLRESKSNAGRRPSWMKVDMATAEHYQKQHPVATGKAAARNIKGADADADADAKKVWLLYLQGHLSAAWTGAFLSGLFAALKEDKSAAVRPNITVKASIEHVANRSVDMLKADGDEAWRKAKIHQRALLAKLTELADEAHRPPINPTE